MNQTELTQNFSIAGNASLLSNDVLAPGLQENEPYRIQLAPVFPFYPISGDSLRYATTPALNPGVPIDFDAGIPTDTKLPDGTNRTFRFAEIATHFRVSYKAQDIYSSNVNDQVSVQLQLAERELLYRFWTMFEQGDATKPHEFDGLLRLVDACRTIDLDFQPLSLEAIDQAKDLVRGNDGRRVVIFTNSIGKRAIHAAHWTRGLNAAYERQTFPTPSGEWEWEQVLVVDGAQVYVNDLNGTFRNVDNRVEKIPVDAVNTTDCKDLGTHIWFFVMGQDHLHGMVPEALGSDMFVTRTTLLPDNSTLVYHITMPVGVALGCASSVAVIKNAAIPQHGLGRVGP